MLEGPELGAALRQAIALKKVPQQQVAAAFGVRQASVSEWLKHGRIAKKHINRLVDWFSDVVGPEHWGLSTESSPRSAPVQQGAPAPELNERHRQLLQFFDVLSPSEQAILLDEAHRRAAKAIGDKILAEKFNVTGYAADRRVEQAFGNVANMPQRRHTDQLVDTPFLLRHEQPPRKRKT